jgi:hypothetical protein
MHFRLAISGVLITPIDARVESHLKYLSVMSFECSTIILLYMDNRDMRCYDRHEPKTVWAMKSGMCRCDRCIRAGAQKCKGR